MEDCAEERNLRMKNAAMAVVQSWDDGVTADARLVEVLRKHKAKATFNLCAGLHDIGRQLSNIKSKAGPITRLGWNEMKEVYSGFTIGNHSLSHPSLAALPLDTARRDVEEGRDRLQQFFDQPVLGFAYPNGSYNTQVMDVIRAAGHVYARTTLNAGQAFPPADAMAFHTSCHFLSPDFWTRYEQAQTCGVFYFWGHSYEIMTEAMWMAFDETIERISRDEKARWADVADLFRCSESGSAGQYQTVS